MSRLGEDVNGNLYPSRIINMKVCFLVLCSCSNRAVLICFLHKYSQKAEVTEHFYPGEIYGSYNIIHDKNPRNAAKMIN